MELQDLFNAGSDILGEVNKAVETNDYSNLSETIRRRVGDVSEQIKQNGYTGYGYTGNRNGNQQVNNQGNMTQRMMGNTGRYHAAPVRMNSTSMTPFLQRKVSSFSGIGRMVIGIVGASINGLITLSMILVATLATAELGSALGVAVFLAIIFGVITGIFSVQIKKGSDFKNLIKRYYRYGKALGQSEYFDYESLAAAVGEKKETIKKDIQKLLKKDILRYAKVDNNNTTVMLTESAYNQYIQAETARKTRELEAQKSLIKEDTTNPNEINIIREGNAYLKQIREINDRIPDTDEMSNKLYKLEEIMHKIFDKVKADPKCEEDLHKFMNYYLPTTTKLLNAYIDLDNQPVKGDNIAQAKHEIEDAMDTINMAFENLLDSLFQDMAWDISSDISVMKTMMAQDGLTEDNKMKVKVPVDR
ncbi:MAG: 5-bromo-4-chloroindolyl phosphate hydrolysis family protein [Butyrivibrio sp.]|nr:5-bromo-4-chloroindolyl phosphate hydrolysis family protein [Butyrivibrio sp.]